MASPERAPEGAGTARLLAELGHAGLALADAAARGDVIAALAASHESRRLRAELARKPLTGDDPALLASLRGLVEGGRTAAAVADTWHERPLPPPQTLVASPLGVACLADELLPTTWDATTDLVVLLGPGLEPVAANLLDLGQARILAVTDPATAAYPPAVSVVADADEAARVVRAMSPSPPERVVLRSLDPTPAELTRTVADAIHTALCDLRVHHNTVAAFSRTWLEQGVANLDAIARWPSVASVDGRLAGIPAIICAPGPSLAHNVALLRELRGRALIIAFSHSLRPLRAAGVVPDVVVTVDPQDVRDHFAPGDLDGVGALINGVTVHPALWQLGVARQFSLAGNGALDRWLYDSVGDHDDADVPGGGSVATTALSLALRWRCDPIVMVGLDLSFPGGQYYVATSCDGAARAEVDASGQVSVAGWSAGFHAMKAAGGPRPARERSIELPGWHGGTVPSSFMFALFHRWFVEVARREQARVTLYNCTEGGARIEGMTHVPLRDVVATLTAPVDVAAALDGALAATGRAARAAAAHRWFGRTRRDLRRALRLARRGAALARGDAATAAVTLPPVERELAAVLRRHDFISMLAQREIAAAFDEARRPALEGDYLAATAKLLEAAARTLGVVGAALDRIEARRGG